MLNKDEEIHCVSCWEMFSIKIISQDYGYLSYINM